jgi:inorganic pyrophosphatase
MNKFKAHPWHGIDPCTPKQDVFQCFVEIVPSDQLKYEIDKASGYLRVDRPQLYSNVVPALYGFFPQTLCDREVGEVCMKQTGKTGIGGDQDPLDVCIITGKNIMHGDILLRARPIGGLLMIDREEADDKIICVMEGDELYEDVYELTDLPEALVRKIRHYFLTYKDMPGTTEPQVEIAQVYGREHALSVIEASLNDYRKRFHES